MGTSGAMSTNNSMVKYTISINQNSQDIAKNYSNVTVSVRFHRVNSGYSTFGTGTIWCKIDGQTYSASVTSSQKITDSGIILFSKTLNISHNSDGSKILATSAWINIDAPLSSSEQGYSQGLTTIPRTSSVSCNSGNIGSNTTISINRSSSGFTHCLYYSIGSISWAWIGTADTSFNWTIPTAIYAQIPNSNSSNVTIICETYTNNGSTYIGNSSCTTTTYVANSNPVFSASNISYLDTNASVVAITGNNQHIIRSQSNLRVNFASATAQNSAAISKYQIIFNGNIQEKTSSGNVDYGLVDSGNDLTLTIKAIDSRGNSTSVSKNITIFDWSTPSAIITANRKNNYENTTYLKVEATISSVNSKNAIQSIQYRNKQTTSSTFSSYSNIINNTQYTLTISNLYAWDFQVLITDKFGQTTYNFTIAKGVPIMFFDTNKLSVGINKFPSNSGSLEANDIYSNGVKIINPYPVGAIYLSVNNTNPTNYFGGTWIPWGSGRVPICVNASDSDFSSAEKTGGNKDHRHIFRIGMHWWYGAAAGESAGNGTGAYRYSDGQYDGWARSLAAKSVSLNTGFTTSGTTGNAAGQYSLGDTDISSSLQPFITCYMWKRTA